MRAPTHITAAEPAMPSHRWAVVLCQARRSVVLVFALSLLLSCSLSALAQRKRPQLRQPQRSQYAGRILLLPFDGHPVSWKLPRMIARLADHELLSPPRELLGNETRGVDADGVIAWAQQQDIAQLNGVIVSLDALAGWPTETNAERCKTRLAFLNWLRQRKPELPIYGFTQQARDELSGFVFDDLLITPDSRDAAYLLVARFLHQTYQRPLKVLPIASAEYPPAVLKALANRIEAVGAKVITSGQADIFLFLHTPNTDETKRANFADALAKAVASKYYVALADLTEQPEALVTSLRERRQLDVLQAYAASPVPEVAIGKALAQCSARLVAAKVLRTTLEGDQWQRAERMQVELMMTRLLEDWAYPRKVRPLLETYVREQLHADPAKLGQATEAAQTFLSHEIKLIADELFRTQFRYNVHSVLLGDGTRADFQPEILQRCKARLPLQRTQEIELDIGVHLPQLIGINPLPMQR